MEKERYLVRKRVMISRELGDGRRPEIERVYNNSKILEKMYAKK